MNILFLTHNSSLRSTTCVLDALINKEHKKSITPIFVFSNVGPWQKELSQKGIKTYIRKFRMPIFKKPFSSILETIFWLFIIKKNCIYIIHVNEHDNFPVISFAAWLLKIPTVVGVRFVVEKGFTNWAFGGRFKPDRLLFTSQDQLSRSSIPEIIPAANVLLFGNGRDLDELTGFPDSRVRMRTDLGVLKSEILLGTASVIRRRKKIEDFITLVEKLRNKGIPVKGIIAGGGKFADPEYYKELEDLIITKKLTDIVIMLGNLEQVAPFYQSIDIFISTSELETFGMSVCEAMAFQKPVIAYEGGSVQEVINDPRCVISTGDQEGLFSKTLEIINNPTLSESVSIKGFNHVFKMFNAPILSSRLKKIYLELID